MLLCKAWNKYYVIKYSFKSFKSTVKCYYKNVKYSFYGRHLYFTTLQEGDGNLWWPSLLVIDVNVSATQRNDTSVGPSCSSRVARKKNLAKKVLHAFVFGFPSFIVLMGMSVSCHLHIRASDETLRRLRHRRRHHMTACFLFPCLSLSIVSSCLLIPRPYLAWWFWMCFSGILFKSAARTKTVQVRIKFKSNWKLVNGIGSRKTSHTNLLWLLLGNWQFFF